MKKSLLRVVKDVSYNVTAPRQARRAEQDTRSVRLARETKHIKLPSSYNKMSAFDKEIQMARLRTNTLKMAVAKRRKAGNQ